MNIRKYTLISIVIIVIVSLLSIFSYQQYFSYKLDLDMEKFEDNYRFIKTQGKDIKIYRDGNWEDFKLKGVELLSFKPGYERFKSSISKDEVMKWLKQIESLNANVIKIPYIQAPSFYSAIYDYNRDSENPIYIIHEIMLDERAVLSSYNAFDGKIIKNLKKDIRKTIKVIHGESVIFSKKRSHSGFYLKDVSKYNLGFIIGTNINPEIVSLTNSANPDKVNYQGQYFSILNGTPFESFIAEILDYTCKYEIKKYKRVSLVSFLTSPETDAFKYKHESNLTKYSNINIKDIEEKSLENLFVSYRFHPNASDFLDYEYIDSSKTKDKADKKMDFSKHLQRLNNFHEKPLVISDIGISSSRALSKLDTNDGFDRGGFSEKEQGQKIVSLLKEIDNCGLSGTIINSWQDNWTNLTSFNSVEDYLDESASSYWHDIQSSDESFGLLKFELGKEKDKVYLDGETSEWDNTKYLLDEEKMKLKIKSDESNLYMLIEKENWSLNKDSLYLGIDISPNSGSKSWKEEAEFSTDADFIIKLKGYNESRIVVNERYNIFNYLYKYYSNIIEKQDKAPKKDSDKFSSIYLLNRKKFYLKDSNKVLSPIYYETGKLIHGNNNENSEDFNSLTDFNKSGDLVEIKIPWTLLNIKNPLDKVAYGDFYLHGIDSKTKIKDIGFSIYFKNDSKKVKSQEVRYEMKNFKSINYFEKNKESYYIVKDYWKENPVGD